MTGSKTNKNSTEEKEVMFEGDSTFEGEFDFREEAFNLKTGLNDYE